MNHNFVPSHPDHFYIGDPPGWMDTYTYPAPEPETRSVKRTTRTVEKFDPEGKLISREVITEEEEIFDKKVWTNDIIYTLVGEGTTGGDINNINNCTITGDAKDLINPISSGSITYKNDVPFTLTNGMANVVANYNSPDLPTG